MSWNGTTQELLATLEIEYEGYAKRQAQDIIFSMEVAVEDLAEWSRTKEGQQELRESLASWEDADSEFLRDLLWYGQELYDDFYATEEWGKVEAVALNRLVATCRIDPAVLREANALWLRGMECDLCSGDA
jgi:hypothetical protein